MRVAKGDELASLLQKQIALLETQNALNEQTKLLKNNYLTIQHTNNNNTIIKKKLIYL